MKTNIHENTFSKSLTYTSWVTYVKKYLIMVILVEPQNASSVMQDLKVVFVNYRQN